MFQSLIHKIPRPRRHWLLWATLLMGASGGCDTAPQAKDASVISRTQVAQVQVRLEFPPSGSPSVSMLAYRAQATDIAPGHVLPAVDPLSSQAPASGCELREVSASARLVRSNGGMVALQELDNVTLEISPSQRLLPAPRVYPPLADVVAGVIAEAGPTDLESLPSFLTLSVGEAGVVRLSPPAAPVLKDSADQPLSGRLVVTGDLILKLSGPSRAFLEIRPFGSPMAMACAPNATGTVVVPQDLLLRLVADSAGTPISFEAVWREHQTFLQATLEPLRVSFEARSQVVLELRL